MELWQFLIFPLSGFIAGVINAVAGGGTMFSYSALLAAGVPPVHANATSSFTVWPGTIASAWAYRQHIRKLKTRYFFMLIPCALGGAYGGWLLAQTSDRTFEYIVPWFIFGAVILMGLQPRLHRWLTTKKAVRFEKQHMPLIIMSLSIIAFASCVYGGYFGAGIGIIILAILGLTQLSDIHEMNGLKNLATVAMNVTAITLFIAKGLIAWWALPFLLIGSISGGYLGARYSEKLPERAIRIFIMIVGISLATYLLVRL